MTALFAAIEKNDYEIAKLLLTITGIDVNSPNIFN